MRHFPYETALQRLRLFSLVRRRIPGDLISIYKIMHGLLDFPCYAVFAASIHIGLRGHTFKIHQQQCKNRVRQHELSVRVVPYWNKLPKEIMIALFVETFQLRLDALVAVPIPRGSLLTRTPILPPEYVPLCSIPPVASSEQRLCMLVLKH